MVLFLKFLNENIYVYTINNTLKKNEIYTYTHANNYGDIAINVNALFSRTTNDIQAILFAISR